MTEAELLKFRFSSGKEVMLRKVSPLFMMKLREQNPPPEVPKQPVSYGGEIGTVLEPNEAHPDYIAAVAAHEAHLEELLRKIYIRRAVVLPKGTKEMAAVTAQVNKLRKEWKEDTGKELEGSVPFLYVSFVCIENENDLGDFLEAVTRTSFRNREPNPNSDTGSKT